MSSIKIAATVGLGLLAWLILPGMVAWSNDPDGGSVRSIVAVTVIVGLLVSLVWVWMLTPSRTPAEWRPNSGHHAPAAGNSRSLTAGGSVVGQTLTPTMPDISEPGAPEPPLFAGQERRGWWGFVDDVLDPIPDRTWPEGSALATLVPHGRLQDVTDLATRVAWVCERTGWGRFDQDVDGFTPAVTLASILPDSTGNGDARLNFEVSKPGTTVSDLQGRIPVLLQELRLLRAVGQAGREHSTGALWLWVSNRPACEDDDDHTAPRATEPDEEWDDDEW